MKYGSAQGSSGEVVALPDVSLELFSASLLAKILLLFWSLGAILFASAPDMDMNIKVSTAT